MLNLVNFEKSWLGRDESIQSKLKDALQPKTQLRNRIDSAVRALDLQGRKLDIAFHSLREKDKHYYNKIVDAMRTYDRNRAGSTSVQVRT